nr:hypothetical protein [uncultured Rhodopila sp.]
MIATGEAQRRAVRRSRQHATIDEGRRHVPRAAFPMAGERPNFDPLKLPGDHRFP